MQGNAPTKMMGAKCVMPLRLMFPGMQGVAEAKAAQRRKEAHSLRRKLAATDAQMKSSNIDKELTKHCATLHASQGCDDISRSGSPYHADVSHPHTCQLICAHIHSQHWTQRTKQKNVPH